MIRKYILLIIVALSITSVQYHRIRHAVIDGPHPEYKASYFLSMMNGLQCFRDNVKYFHRARIVSCFTSSITCKAYGLKCSKKQPTLKYSNAIATDQCVWLMLTFIAIIVFSKRPLFFILGTGAALQYSWLPLSEFQVAPWDMPTLFWWTLVLLINNTKYKHAILYLIPAGSLYKEIIAVLSILVLFWDEEPLNRRIMLFLCLGFTCVLIKMAQGIVGGCGPLNNQSWHYEWNPAKNDYVCRTGEKWIWQRNLHSLGWWSNFNPIYFSVAGVWTGLFLLPIPWMYRIIAMVYCGTVFIPGNITEARLWQELIPVFFVGYESIKQKGFLCQKQL